MSRRRSLQVLTVLAVALFCASAVSLAQTKAQGAALLLRAQALSIAEEMWPRLSDTAKPSNALRFTVEGGSARPLVENALLEFFSKQGVMVYDKGQGGETFDAIHLTVLEQGVHYRSVEGEEYQREVRTVLEARRTSPNGGTAQHGGIFQRFNVDTVAFREDLGFGTASGSPEPSLFNRVVGPLVLIGSTFLVVYLFFTVRN